MVRLNIPSFPWADQGRLRLPVVANIHHSWSPLRRFKSGSLRCLVLPALIWFTLAFIFLASYFGDLLASSPIPYEPPRRMSTTSPPLEPLSPRIPCVGPRGLSLAESPDDELLSEKLDIKYPIPLMGSHRELGAETSWMTADGRYGPYGYGEDGDAYTRARVDWDKTDWGWLQDQCMERNAERFPDKQVPSARTNQDRRFSLLKDTLVDPVPAWDASNNSTRRTALVIRAYEGFKYTPRDMWHIRSLIVEAGLRTGGEYVVFLLVNIQKRSRKIFESEINYAAAFDSLGIPPELQSMTVLWDDSLLESWYPRIRDHSSKWQIYQPMQLFALHYPEYDHYWDLELDQRFMGDAGKYLDSMHSFSRQEPRKQALERATFAFNEELYGSFEKYIHLMDKANNGRSRSWGPVSIPDIHPIGPEPPSAFPQDDPFKWGVGEDADLVVSSHCRDALAPKDWYFRKYVKGFAGGRTTPRWYCPPAVMRSSRALLLTAHEAHHLRGQTVASESTLPSWALWHGLKISYPPQPVYLLTDSKDKKKEQQQQSSSERLQEISKMPWFGLKPEEAQNPKRFGGEGLTWWWRTDAPRRIMDAWLSGDANADDLPELLAVKNGKVFVPNLAMHPVKT